MLINFLSVLLLILGLGALCSGVVGMLRFTDFYCKIHAAGVIDSCAIPLVLLGLLLRYEFSFLTFKILLLIIFLLLTNPTACYALAHTAYLHEKKK